MFRKSATVRGLAAMCAAVVTLVLSGTTQATVYTWDGGGSGSRWDTAANWVGDIAWSSSANNQVVFYASGAAQLSTKVGEYYTIGSLEFTADATSAVTIELQNYNGAARTLTLGSASVAPTITVASSANVEHILGSTDRGSVILANNLTVTIDGASGTRLQIAQPITGNYGITKDGSGLLTLSDVNTYTGNTTVNTGTLTLANGASLLMNINDDDSTQLLGNGTINLNGRLNLDVSGFTDIRWKSWDLVDVANLTETYGAAFEIGFNGGSAFTEGSGRWTYKDTNGRWQFTQATGTLEFVPNNLGMVITVQ